MAGKIENNTARALYLSYLVTAKMMAIPLFQPSDYYLIRYPYARFEYMNIMRESVASLHRVFDGLPACTPHVMVSKPLDNPFANTLYRQLTAILEDIVALTVRVDDLYFPEKKMQVAELHGIVFGGYAFPADFVIHYDIMRDAIVRCYDEVRTWIHAHDSMGKPLEPTQEQTGDATSLEGIAGDV